MISIFPDFSSIANQVFEDEIAALKLTQKQLNESFTDACKLILSCRGKVVLIGMGKSGHIAKKIAATLASTGTSSFFVHPAEALHGDLGMIEKGDIVVVLSYSGNTPEILALLPYFLKFNLPIIAITQNKSSALAEQASVLLNIDIQNKEACPLNLAPTSSTTVSLVLGDALAIALLKAKGFQEADFAQYHPAGSLGKKLLLQVEAVMHAKDQLPKVLPSASLKEAILEMTKKRLGMTTVCSEQGELSGIFTDGDLRRAFEKGLDPQTTSVHECMSENPKTLHSKDLAAKAAGLMREFQITAIPVLNEQNQLVGVIHLHDLLKHGVM